MDKPLTVQELTVLIQRSKLTIPELIALITEILQEIEIRAMEIAQ